MNSISGSGSYGGNEKRRKPMQMSSMTYMLEDNDIMDDLKIINKNKAFSVSMEGNHFWHLVIIFHHHICATVNFILQLKY